MGRADTTSDFPSFYIERYVQRVPCIISDPALEAISVHIVYLRSTTLVIDLSNLF